MKVEGTIGFVGAGNMGEALIRGLLTAGVAEETLKIIGGRIDPGRRASIFWRPLATSVAAESRPFEYSTSDGMSTTRPMFAPQWQAKTPTLTSSADTSRSSG